MNDTFWDLLAEKQKSKNWGYFVWKLKDAMGDICFDTEEELKELIVNAIKLNNSLKKECELKQ